MISAWLGQQDSFYSQGRQQTKLKKFSVLIIWAVFFLWVKIWLHEPQFEWYLVFAVSAHERGEDIDALTVIGFGH